MPGHDIIVIGASAGGVEALRTVVGALPAGLPASVFVVLHIPAEAVSVLPQILDRAGPLTARHPDDKEEIVQGTIYVAPPGNDLLLEPERVRLVRGPSENRHRPALDPLFRSAAVAYGPRVTGVVLTGSLDDGTAGLHAIKVRGGMAVVQDPADALYAGMPTSAISHVPVDYVEPLDRIAPKLVELAQTPAPAADEYPIPASMVLEARIAAMEPSGMEEADKLGQPSGFTCPDCHGSLWEIQDGEITRFRCQVGHAYSVNSMLAEQSAALEKALWAALRSFEERIGMARRLSERARQRNHINVARRFDNVTLETEQHASVLRQILARDDNLDGAEAEEAI